MGQAVAWVYFEKSRVRETDSHSVQSCPAGPTAAKCSEGRSTASSSLSQIPVRPFLFRAIS